MPEDEILGEMPTEIKVKDVMISRVVTARPTQTVFEAAKIMKKEDIGSVIVCESSKPIGIVTREDIVTKVVSKDLQPSKIQLKKIMNAPLITCSPDDDLATVSRKIAKYNYERIPVVKLGKLIGIIADRDIAKVCPAAMQILRERLMIEEPPPVVEEFNSGDCELCGNYSESLHYINDRWVCDSCKEEAGEL